MTDELHTCSQPCVRQEYDKINVCFWWYNRNNGLFKKKINAVTKI